LTIVDLRLTIEKAKKRARQPEYWINDIKPDCGSGLMSPKTFFQPVSLESVVLYVSVSPW
jgi:hypothetical protein